MSISKVGIRSYRWMRADLQIRPAAWHRRPPQRRGVITVLVIDVILGVAVLALLIYRQLSSAP